MTTVDPSKGVWRVMGHLPAPDGRRMTCFVNANDEQEALALGRLEGLATEIRATFHTPEQIAKWEAFAANMKPMTPEEIEKARKQWLQFKP